MHVPGLSTQYCDAWILDMSSSPPRWWQSQDLNTCRYFHTCSVVTRKNQGSTGIKEVVVVGGRSNSNTLDNHCKFLDEVEIVNVATRATRQGNIQYL